jgi:hypothetical protein
MGRRFPFPAVAACLVAGIALWFTRASLDVASGPQGELRVAMFPSWAELAGLIVLTGVVVFLLSTLLRHLLRRRGLSPQVPIDPLLPLFSLAWLAVPYLPWLADAVPTLRVFAGPARYGVWAVVLGQVVWLTWQTMRGGDGAAVHTPRMLALRSMWVLAITAAVLGTAATLLTRGPLHPGGDEPHYLVIAQSVLRDGDLRIENNHRRGDYREYFDRSLKPDYIARGRDGAVYSIHPVGLPLLIAPAFAAGGYPGVATLLVLLAAATAALAWWWGARRTGLLTSATVAWLAVAGSASFVLHSFTVYPEIAAALAVLTVVAWTPSAGRIPIVAPILQGLIVGTLPWLSTKYAPMSAVVALVVAARHRSARRAIPVLVTYAASVVAWLGFFAYIWGSPLPTAPYGSAHQTALRHVAVGLPALLFDQEYGLLPYAPALLLAGPGLWQMWVRGGVVRREAWEIVLIGSALMVTVSAYAMWWGGSSAPARQLVAILPILVLPIAWWDAWAARRVVLGAAGRVLVLVGTTITATLVTVRSGLLAANRRDGSSQFLEWMAPSNDLVRIAPSFIADRDTLLLPLLIAAIWVAAVVACGVMLSRIRLRSAGNAPAVAVLIVVTTCLGAAAAVPAAMGGRLPPRTDPAAQAESAMLSTFDARARPAAVLYDAWQPVSPAEVPPLFAFEGRPGLRRDRQPLQVLLNTRLALPAGRYDVELVPSSGTGLDGRIGLQLGRTGRPVREWRASSGADEAWTQEFRVHVDTPFVGFRTSPELEGAVGEIVVRPRSVVNAAERLERRLALPPVLAAAQYRGVAVYFHDGGAYPEPDGFWVRGATDLITTMALPPDSTRSTVRLKVHTGAGANRVRFSSGEWDRAIYLTPGEVGEIEVPILASSGQAVVRISPATGFVPAETSGGADRRLLGCWIEVLD